jgi:hypothetical protein
VALLLGLLAAPVAFFHFITQGPKEAQPPGQDPGFGDRPAETPTKDPRP